MSECTPLHLLLQNRLECVHSAHNILLDSVLHNLVAAGKRHWMRLVRCAVTKRVDTEEVLLYCAQLERNVR
jgi:hypothetical protein